MFFGHERLSPYGAVIQLCADDFSYHKIELFTNRRPVPVFTPKIATGRVRTLAAGV